MIGKLRPKQHPGFKINAAMLDQEKVNPRALYKRFAQIMPTHGNVVCLGLFPLKPGSKNARDPVNEPRKERFEFEGKSRLFAPKPRSLPAFRLHPEWSARAERYAITGVFENPFLIIIYQSIRPLSEFMTLTMLCLFRVSGNLLSAWIRYPLAERMSEMEKTQSIQYQPTRARWCSNQEFQPLTPQNTGLV
jgi:hypothetical protein